MIDRRRRHIVWTPAAEIDVANAALWYEDRQHGLGELFTEAVEATAHQAARSPERYLRVHRNLRRAFVGRFPYGLIFREADNEVVVLACYHLHRDPDVWKSRA